MVEKYISENKKFTVEDMKRMQADTVDVYAKKVLPGIL